MANDDRLHTQNYSCIDPGAGLTLDSTIKWNLNFDIFKCSPNSGVQCKSDAEIDAFLNGFFIYFSLITVIQEYDSTDNQMKEIFY